MARKKTPKVRVNVKASLSRRLREIRQELFGEHGGPELARRLNLPARTWYNYETGVTVPAEVLLGFIDQTGANPIWLLSGEGPQVPPWPATIRMLSDLTPIELIRRGLEKLEQEPERRRHRRAGEPARRGRLRLRRGQPGPAAGADRQGVLDPSQRRGLHHGLSPVAPQPGEHGRRPARRRRDVPDPAGGLDRGRSTARSPTRSSSRGGWSPPAPKGEPMIRWLDLSGRHMILRPNQPSREHPLIPVELDDDSTGVIIGQVVWSWSRFSES